MKNKAWRFQLWGEIKAEKCVGGRKSEWYCIKCLIISIVAWYIMLYNLYYCYHHEYMSLMSILLWQTNLIEICGLRACDMHRCRSLADNPHHWHPIQSNCSLRNANAVSCLAYYVARSVRSDVRLQLAVVIAPPLLAPLADRNSAHNTWATLQPSSSILAHVCHWSVTGWMLSLIWYDTSDWLSSFLQLAPCSTNSGSHSMAPLGTGPESRSRAD